MATNSLLEGDQDAFYEKLFQLQQAAEGAGNKQVSESERLYSTILPQPGFCLKTKTDKDEKVFINVCHAENIPAPKDLSDEDLLKLLESEDQSGYRIPMSIGEAHVEVDNSGHGCTAYDVIVNKKFFEELEKRQILLGFVLTVVLEGLEYKYDLSLSREWKMMKNRKFMGKMEEQNIRSKQKPLIMDMESTETNLIKPSGNKQLIQEISDAEASTRKIPEPPYTIIQEPPTGHPDFLVAEIHLPKLKVAASMTLDIGEDRILLQTRSNIYLLDVFLPFNIIQEEAGAQFNRKTKILTVLCQYIQADFILN